MKSRKEVIAYCLKNCKFTPSTQSVDVFAPANLAMIKYWGKRDIELNLPVTSSLSISLKDKGTSMRLTAKSNPGLELYINDQEIPASSKIFKRLNAYLADYPFHSQIGLAIHSHSNIPIGAGLASSSSAFAALVKGLNALFVWDLDLQTCSILARMGSGSAARSFWDGFVIWHKGDENNGLDSYAAPLTDAWDDLKIGLLILEDAEKPIGSTDAMIQTVNTSELYKTWPQRVADDLSKIQTAIEAKDFYHFGEIAEKNAIFMHYTMADARPSISYATSKTIETIAKIHTLRKEGLPVFFTQDAGPNIKLIYLAKDAVNIKHHFPTLVEI